MFKSYVFVLSMRARPGLPLGEAAAALFESLASIYAAQRFGYVIDGGSYTWIPNDGDGVWEGEEITGDALTLFRPAVGRGLIDQLRRVLLDARPSELWVRARGALRHRAPWTQEDAWYGRWRCGGVSSELVEVTFSWMKDDRSIEIAFPVAGYPLTSVSPLATPDGTAWLADGDPNAAAANRALVFDALAGIARALGLARTDVVWELHGDASVLDARYPEDAAAVRAAFRAL